MEDNNEFYNDNSQENVDYDYGYNESNENYEKEYKKEKPSNSTTTIVVLIVLLGVFATGAFILSSIVTDSKRTIKDFEEKYSNYNDINDSYKEFVKYLFVDLERTATTTFPVLIKDLPETKDYSKYCLPCTSIYPDLQNVFFENLTKRKLENISHIPLSETDLYLNLASKTNELIDNYNGQKYLPASEILKLPSITDLDLCNKILRSWLWASMYYASQNKNEEALLLAYAPILVCQDIEANSADGASMNTEMQKVQIEACEQLIYLANFSRIDSKLSKKISINFIKVINSEPSFVRKLDNYLRCSKNFYSFLEKENNAFAKFVHNSNTYKDWYNKLYNGAREQITEIEKTGNFSKFYLWQKDFNSLIEEAEPIQNNKNKNIELDPYKRFNEFELTMCRKAFSKDYTDYFYYYCRNLEKIAIMKGTAVALAFSAYETEKNLLPLNEGDLNNWLGIDIPFDPLTRRPYVFYSKKRSDMPSAYRLNRRCDYLFSASSFPNAYYKCTYLKDDLKLIIDGITK